MTAEEFKVLYAEFAPTPNATIEAKMAEMELLTSDSYGDRREFIIGLKTADALAGGPQGRKTRRVEAESTQAPRDNPYGARLRAYQKANAWANNRT